MTNNRDRKHINYHQYEWPLYRSRSLSLSVSLSVYVCARICVYIWMYASAILIFVQHTKKTYNFFSESHWLSTFVLIENVRFFYDGITSFPMESWSIRAKKLWPNSRLPIYCVLGKLILILKARWPMEMDFDFGKLSPSALLMWQEQWLTVYGPIFKQHKRSSGCRSKFTRHSLNFPPENHNYTHGTMAFQLFVTVFIQ